MPPFSVLVMPAALATMLLMPFGLEVVPLAVMQHGIDLVVTIARTVADWSAAAGHMPAPPAAALLLVVLGLLWLALWQTSWRLLGLLPCLAGIVVAVLAPRPDIIVGRDGAAAVRGPDGSFHILGSASAFEIDNWLRADGDARLPDDPTLNEGVACDDHGCTVPDQSGNRVALAHHAGALVEDCRRARVVISTLAGASACSGKVRTIDAGDLDRHGAHALYRDDGSFGGYRVETTYPAIRRSFMPPAVSSGG